MAPHTSPTASPWSDLLPEDLLGLVLIRLPLLADRARFGAVCRAWHSAACHYLPQTPLMVFPDGSFDNIGQHDDKFYYPTKIISGLPENVTCLGAAAAGWLALDYTDNVFRRTHLWDKFTGSGFLKPRRDVKHMHKYRLYNPFTGKTILLPELDSVIGEVAETFDICKVLMRRPSSDSSDDDQLVVIITDSWNYNVIICRPGKGSYVQPNIRVFDVAFYGDKLYGITQEEALVALDLAEDDKGAPIVTKCRRVIKTSLANGEEDEWSWMYNDNRDDNGNNDEEDIFNDNNDNNDEEDLFNDDDDNNDDEQEDSLNGDGLVPSGEGIVKLENKNIPYDVAIITRRLVHSSHGDGDGELLLVRHRRELCPRMGNYTVDVDIFKADIEAQNWVPVNELAQGETLFLSRSFSKSIRAYGDIKQGFVYYTYMDDVFHTKSRVRSFIRFPKRWEGADRKLLTWLFPPEL